jgi:hypothetical protein
LKIPETKLPILPRKPDHPEIATRRRPKISRRRKSSLGTRASRTITVRACSIPRRAVEDAIAVAVMIAADVPTAAAVRIKAPEAIATATARPRDARS